MAKRKYQRTSKHFGADPLYNEFIFVVQTSDTNKRAAERLGISTSTLQRWKAYGISDRAYNDKIRVKKIKNVARSMHGSITRKLRADEAVEPRLLSYNRYFDGVLSKYWIVRNASFEQMLEIVLQECYRNLSGQALYSGFRIRFKLETPFEGITDGYGNFMSVDEINNQPARERKKIRDTGSWINTTLDRPYLSSKIIAFERSGTPCHPDEVSEALSKYYYMQHVRIEELVFSEIRRGDDGAPIDFYKI